MNPRLHGEDAAWFHMEDATNPMVVCGMIELEGILSMEEACELLRRLATYRRFSARVVEPLLHVGLPSWHAVALDVAEHVEHLRLEANDDATLRAFIGRTLGGRLDPKRPLWRVYLVDRPGRGTTILFRVHHAIADGYALLALLRVLSNGDSPGVTPRETRRRGSRWRNLLRSARALHRLLMLPRDPATTLHATPSGDKRVAWSEPLALSAVKRIGGASSATVNDVLVAIVTGALHRYLERGGVQTPGLELHAIAPVNLRSPGSRMDLGNRFGVVVLALPVGIEEPITRIVAVRQRMKLLKESAEATVAHGLLTLMGYAPRKIEEAAAEFFGKKASLVLTNLPGPRERLTLSRIPISRMMFWVPEAAHLGLGVSIFSYAGEVTVGVLSDASVVSDPDALMADFHAEFAAAEAECRA